MGLFEVSGLWLVAIGKTIVHSLWIGLLILAIVRLALAYIPFRLSGLRYSISVSALLVLFISTFATFLLLHDPGSATQVSAAKPGIFSSVSGKLISLNFSDEVLDTSLIFSLCGYIYFAGALLMLLRSAASLFYVRRLKDSGTQLDQEWQSKLLQTCKSLGIKRPVSFLESTQAKGPMLVGYLKPAVIVPAGMITMLPVSQIETIIMHELYHLKRGDFLVNIMQLFIEGVLFYHPVVWIISGFIRSEREHCCDNRVLHSCQNPVNYARALIHIAEQQQFTRLAPGAVGSRKQHFSSRIKRILNYDTMKTNMRDKVVALTLLCGSIVILLTLNGFSTGPNFFVIDKANSERIAEALVMSELPVPDTIPEKNHPTEPEEHDHEVMMVELEEAHLEALEEIEEIDWEAMKEEVKEAHMEALEEIEEIDWEAMKVEVKEAHMEALKEIEEIDWEEVRTEMELSISEMKIDMAEMKRDIEESMNEIDWDEIRADIEIDLEKVRLSLDSIKIDMDL